MQEFIARTIEKPLRQALFQGKILIIYGPRQVGKTTLVKKLQTDFPDSLYLNCDEPDIRAAFTDATSTALKSFLGNARLVFLDEAQRVKNIGLTLKLLVDTFPELQVVATGSSSFDLSNKIAEPLTGRARVFRLYPFSLEELAQEGGARDTIRTLEARMILGSYPEIARSGALEAPRALQHLASSYLFKDALYYQDIKHPEAVERLLQALALQVGAEVSYNEVATTVGIDKKTVERYVHLLEAAFVIFRLPPLARNMRAELTKMRKIYFYDNGIRNALINNFNALSLRQDTGALWENFLISERLKANHNHGRDVNAYFWRTKDGKEIDYVEEAGGVFEGFEFKWSNVAYAPPRYFLESYPKSNVRLVHKENIDTFVRLS